MFESDAQRDASLAPQIFDCVAQQGTRAAGPRTAVGFEHIAEEEVLLRRAVAEIDVRLGHRVGLENQIAERSER